MHFSLPAIILTLAAATVAIPLTPLQGVDNACYYKRSINAYVKRDASSAEVVCGKLQQKQEKRYAEAEAVSVAAAVPPAKVKGADNACYYKRDTVSGTSVGYKRDASGAEVLCGAATS